MMARWTLAQIGSFLEIVEGVEEDDMDAFASVLKRCPNVDVTYRVLASWANVSPNSVRRWAKLESIASRYDQAGLLEDIKCELRKRIGELSAELKSAGSSSSDGGREAPKKTAESV